MHAHTHACTHTCTYTHIMNTGSDVRVHTHTHTHTQTHICTLTPISPQEKNKYLKLLLEVSNTGQLCGDNKLVLVLVGICDLHEHSVFCKHAKDNMPVQFWSSDAASNTHNRIQCYTMKGHPDGRPPIFLKDHTDEGPCWWKTNISESTLMKDHLISKRPPYFWKTTLMKDHLNERPHNFWKHLDERLPNFWKTTLMKDHLNERPHNFWKHPDERPPNF